ncbi:MAG TPA: DUF11 domain-containing protein, partial [Capillimicrobium sp.]|nr:DUF11 domain-containing protein [Capillimicrobium sp.]
MASSASSKGGSFPDQDGNATVNVTFNAAGTSATFTGDKALSNYLVTFCDGSVIDVDSVGGDHKTYTFTYDKPIAWIQVKAGTTRKTFSRDCNGGGGGGTQYPVLKVTKNPASSTLKAGASQTFTLEVANDGEATATGVELCDTPDDQWTFVETNGASIDDGTACWTIGDLAPGAEATRTIKLKLAGTATGTATNVARATATNAAGAYDDAEVTVKDDGGGNGGGGGNPGGDWPKLPPGGDPNGDFVHVEKVEVHVDLAAGETKKVTVTCPNGGYMTDAFPRVDHVDQGTGALTDIAIVAVHSTGPSTYEVVLRNDAFGRAQLKVFGLCVGKVTVNHQHPLKLSGLKKVTETWTPGRHSVTLRCADGQVPVAPGFELDGGSARLVRSELDGSDGWTFTLEVANDGEAT